MNKNGHGQEAVDLLQEVLTYFETEYDERYVEAGPEESEFLLGFNRRFTKRIKSLIPEDRVPLVFDNDPDPDDVLLGMLREKSERLHEEKNGVKRRGHRAPARAA